MQTSKFQLAMEGHLEQALRIDRRIALEADFLANFASTLRNGIPQMLDSFSKALRLVEIPTDSKSKVNLYRPEFLRLLDKHNYVHLSDIDVFVPEGFQGNLVDYGQTLQTSVEHAVNVAGDVVTPYNIFLSKLISSNNARLSSFGELGYLSSRDAVRERLNGKLGTFFRSSSFSDKQPMGKVVSRNADWHTLMAMMPKILDTLSTVSTQTVQGQVDECLELISGIKNAALSGSMDNLSGPMIRQLSQATLSVAREVEFYSITAFRVETLNKAIDDTVDKLTKVLK